MVEKDQIAIIKFIPKATDEIRLCALIPFIK
jgi:hypothetical protein